MPRQRFRQPTPDPGVTVPRSPPMTPMRRDGSRRRRIRQPCPPPSPRRTCRAPSTTSSRCLAGAIYFESKGEPLAGQLAVAEVIINRTKSGRFPTSICSVVTQRGPVLVRSRRPHPAIAADRAAYRTALAVAQVALDRSPGTARAAEALFFHARRVVAGLAPDQGRARSAITSSIADDAHGRSGFDLVRVMF